MPERNLASEFKAKLKTECGVFGLYLDPTLANSEIVELALDCALENQHRGEESVGICISDGYSQSLPLKRMGQLRSLYEDYIKQKRTSGGIFGNIAIVHNRYSTTGSSTIENAAPFRFETPIGTCAISHNGNVTNAIELKQKLWTLGIKFTSSTDSEVIGALISTHPANTWEEKIEGAVRELEGAFCLIVTTVDSLFACRDRNGIHPLSIAKFNVNDKECYAISSETPAFGKLPIAMVSDVQPGELIQISSSGFTAKKFTTQTTERFCGLELAYLMRPDSRFDGVQLNTIREKFGELLATKHPVPATTEVVTYIPESAKPAAEGYAKQISQTQNRFVPSTTTMIKGRYGTLNGAVRGFINPNEAERKRFAKHNYYAYDSVIGKEIALIDDSIIVGITTSGVTYIYKNTIGILKDQGVSKVHLRIVFPPVISSCPFGVDIDDSRFLVAREFHKNLDQIADYIGADSLAYLSIDEFQNSIDHSLLRNVGLCKGCTTGIYPQKIRSSDKFVFEKDIR